MSTYRLSTRPRYISVVLSIGGRVYLKSAVGKKASPIEGRGGRAYFFSPRLRLVSSAPLFLPVGVEHLVKAPGESPGRLRTRPTMAVEKPATPRSG